jgi:hypothetical protein
VTDQDVYRVVEEVAAAALRGGRASLRLDEHGVTLQPHDASASPVGLTVQSDEEVSLFVGHYGTTVDIYDRDPSSLLETLKEFVAAIIDGRYEEEVRLAKESRGRILGKARGVFHLGPRDHEITYSYVPSLGRREPWQRLTYSPY